MVETAAQPGILVHGNLKAFFHDALSAELARQQLRAQPVTVGYLADLLTAFLRTERLYEQTPEGLGFRPLALRHGDTLLAAGAHQRSRALRDLGDVALFVAGVLAESLNRKLVDVDYYAAMGGSAYARLADTLSADATGQPFSSMFAELAHQFIDYADVLGEVAEHPEVRQHRDVLRLYDRWLKTGSHLAAQYLSAAGAGALQRFRISSTPSRTLSSTCSTRASPATWALNATMA